MLKLLISCLLAALGLAATTFSAFSTDAKFYSTVRIGWTTDAVITNFNVKWGLKTDDLPNATAYRSDSSSPPWSYTNLTAGNPTSVYTQYGHGCKTGHKILISGATGGWAPLNGVRTCTYTDAQHFTLDADTTGASGDTIGTARYLRWEVALAGLPAGTTIYYRACAASGTDCSDVQNFATDSAPANLYPDPTLPTASGALTTLPTSYARTESTVTSCGNLQSAVTTALGRGETGHVLLPIQKGLHCACSSDPCLTIGSNTNTGYLVIRPDSADTELPPSGVRVSPNWEASMVTLSGAAFGYNRKLIYMSDTNRIYLMGLVFDNDFPPWDAQVKQITGVTAGTPITYTIASHGWANDDVVQIREVVGVSNANITNCKLQNKATDTFECKGSSGSGTYVSGGYAVRTPPRAPHPIQAYGVTNFVIDRCVFRHVWPGSGYAGALVIANRLAVVRSTDINIINNYFYDLGDWVPVDPDTGARATCCSNSPSEAIIMGAADRILFQNNYVDIPGISFFDDGSRTTDLTYKRNYNLWNPARKYTGSSTGWPITVRQQFEMKTCFRCLLDGNRFVGQWRGGLGQGTGGFNATILFSGRSNASGLFEGEYGFLDLTLTNNTVEGAPGGINIGNAGGEQAEQKPIRNVLIRNNIMWGIDWAAADAVHPTDTGAPAFLTLNGPFENLRIEHNSFWDNRASAQANAWNRAIAFYGSHRGGYLRMRDNFWAHNHESAYGNIYWTDYGSGILPAVDNSPNTDSIYTADGGGKFLLGIDFAGNVVVPGVTDSRYETYYNNKSYNYSQSTCATYWTGRSGVGCHGASEETAYARFDTIKFFGYGTSTRNFRLRHDSAYISGGASRASDHLDVGADIDALMAAQGRVGNVRVRGITASAATVSYLAPDSMACTVEYGTSAVWGSGTRQADGGGDRVRNVDLSGLAGATTHYYRVLCAAEQPSGSFRTL